MVIYWLVLGGDLSADCKQVGPMTAKRLEGAVEKADDLRNQQVVFCTAATFSPTHEEQQELPMSTLAAVYLHDQLGIPAEQIVDITGEGSFNTRGEFAKFVGHAWKLEIPLHQLVISSAWWHIPRAKAIFRQMFGKEATEQVTFIGTTEPLTVKLAAYELAKRGFMYLPERLRQAIETTVRGWGWNPSWPSTGRRVRRMKRRTRHFLVRVGIYYVRRKRWEVENPVAAELMRTTRE
jgi:uncharacterized SAM-binding protein YcdF (DUF218 family)